jgi:hypothetical protein
VVVIFECKDDRSRYLVSLTAWPAERACQVFCVRHVVVVIGGG